MKRIVLSAILAVSTVCVAYGFSRHVSRQENNVYINTKSDLGHGIAVIGPSDPSFDEKLAAITSGDEDLRQLVEVAKPFSLFIKNESGRDIVGCSIKWEFMKTDGTVVPLGNSYSTPGVLMGMKPVDPSLANKTSLVGVNSAVFLSYDPLVKQYVDVALNNPVGTASLNQKSREFMRGYVAQLRQQQEKLTQSVTNITVSIDGAVFDDGLFVGPDSNMLFTHLQALIDAQRDLSQSVDRDLKQKKKSGEILDKVEGMSKKPRAENKPEPLREDYYAQTYDESLHLYADELLRVKNSRGSDAAVQHARGLLSKPWPKLRKE